MPHERFPIHWLLGLLAMWPALWLALFYAFVLLTTIYLNAVPTYGNPDPQSLPYSYLYAAVFYGMMGVIYAAIVFGLFMLLAPVLNIRVRGYWKLAIAGVACFGLFLVLRRYDPGHFFVWLLD